MTIPELYAIFKQHPSVQTDTRKLQQGDLFFALKGPNFNANSFALQALEAGAAYAIIDEPVEGANGRCIVVEDVLTTLQQLAGYHRAQFNIPFIAITGSNGKTTTKELVSTVLGTHFITYTTQGNLNNHIGIPLTLLRVQPDAQMAVIEMGANHQKEIEGYCVYTKPTHGIITNAGKAHLEGFGGVEGVRKGKGELFDYLRAHEGTAFAYNDYDYLHNMIQGVKHVEWYGTQTGTVTGQVAVSEPFLGVYVQGVDGVQQVQTQLVGDYNLPNVLCAITLGKYFGVPGNKIQAAIEGYAPSNSRSQLVEKDGNKIILDAYNANPTSMRAAIENFAKLHAAEKILLLGGMMELGPESIGEHEAIVQLLQQYPWKQVVLVGGDFAHVTSPFIYLPDSLAARQWLHDQHVTGAHILVKGSRSTRMERILEN
ncbi:UDP-N-acetylmuramoyl-tripeptide--D-alanyl-D-alanine ligase [Deminuibacter soli]|uniref:UDP-N-acetylmuramoyl-tripeptide--D-alanyl-D-alanine ligase n=1 Tax=Deminuibacter soli TaxID=2291815 RepID=A0A3E1NP17_9BACT|nr:UDP-N-acetylmuramoyl-tripeptide--D-alanyl-D-alanine ligase [Deminuibacter soli]RFM29660.1 UDP-N-acetylmuramoyl-tripeptide--D-alanyl-D-alanine ligase [Deminuibacter soli]